MKKLRFIAITCLLALLCGCAVPVVPENTASNEQTVVNLTEIAPMDRCAATSLGSMVETGNGYYITMIGRLYYADKTDLTNWVPVCSKPDCTHDLRYEDCNASVRGLWSRDGMLYTMSGTFTSGGTDVILKSAGDGSGWTTAFSDDNDPLTGGIGVMYQFYQDGLCLNVSQMGTDGLWDNYLYFVDDSGAHKYIYGEDFPDQATCSQGNDANEARGDLTMYLLQEYPEDGSNGIRETQKLYRVSPERVEKLEFPEGCSYYGAYLAGDTMIHYHPNDGFYRLTLSTGREEKIAEAAYSDGYGYCLDGKFLVETTVNRGSVAETPQLRYYNGSAWMEVKLPENMKPSDNLWVRALTSDALFFGRSGENHASILSMVKLGDSKLVDCMECRP